MNNEEFKNNVKNELTEFGILVDNNTSIFSTDKIVQNETDESLMLVTPNRQVWIWLGSMMPAADFDDGIDTFKKAVTAYVQETVTTGITVNPNVSVNEFLEGIAKMFGGKSPTENIATAKLTDLVTQAMTPVNEQ